MAGQSTRGLRSERGCGSVRARPYAAARPRTGAAIRIDGETEDAIWAEREAARRRAVLLAAATALPAVLVLGGATSAWPLFALPLAVSMPLGGHRGMAAAVTTAALATAVASGRPGTDGIAIAVGLCAFAATGVAVGAGHRAQRRDAERVAGLSFEDRLTGLHNYSFFADALPRECRRAARYEVPLSLVLLDVDDFKGFNDRHGHDAGNRLLAAIGEAIREGLRGSDLAARYGGDEFALIVPGPLSEAMAVSARIRAAVDEIRVRVADGATAGVTVSAGVASLSPVGDPEGAELLESADRALYHAKGSGRDRAVPAPGPVTEEWAAAS
ncbi:MAG: GGDEF domain-containing protein [Thermoleophilia bacterium]